MTDPVDVAFRALMRQIITTTCEVVGLGIICIAVFMAAPFWAGLLAVGCSLLLIGAAEGRK